MSRTITISGIIIAILALSFCGIYYAKENKIKFNEIIDKALVQCEKEDIDGLVKSTKEMSALLKSRHSFLSFFVRHDEIEKIDTDLVNLIGYTKLGSLESIQICLEHIRFMVDHIYQKEIPNIENLF